MKKFFLLTLVLAFFTSFSQNFERGLILPKKTERQYPDQFCCVLSPAGGFTAYDQPNGKVIGKISKDPVDKKNDQTPYYIYFRTKNGKSQIKTLAPVGYEILALSYKDSKAGFIKIETPKKEVWLKTSELVKEGFKAVTWRDYLLSERDEVLGYYANDPGLQLRKKPDATSEIIGSVRGDLFEIKLTTEVFGQWCKVKVTKYREHVCSTELSEEKNLEYRSEGWMKIIDDNGEPNLWSYTKGC